MCESWIVNGAELIKRIRRLGRSRAVTVRFDPRRGKGSHGRLFYGDRFTTIKDRRKEIGPNLFKDMLKQLGIGKDEL